ncbi:MAG: hypothetical protein U0R19_19105 [Bryobacteraceae bacterium]
MRVLLTLLLVLGTGNCAPRITSVHNAASLGRLGTPNYPVAPGSLVRIVGEGLGPEEAVRAEGFPAPKELGGVTVQVTGSGQTLEAWVVEASATRVTFLLPSTARVGDFLVRVRYREETSPGASMAVAMRSFGIFTSNGLGSGPADGDFSLLKAVTPGQTVTVRGTGLGAIDASDGDAPRVGDLRTGLQVFVGMREAKVTNAGRASCCPGVDEVTFTVPEGTEGCYVPVVTVMEDVLDGRLYGQRKSVSNAATIAVASDGGVCSDPLGLSGADLTKLQSLDAARVGVVLLGHTYSNADLGRSPVGVDRGWARFQSVPGLKLLRAAGIFGLPAAGTCLHLAYDNAVDAVVVDAGGAALDAGAALRVNGPSGGISLTRGSDGSYTATAGKEFFVGGTYELAGDGGADVGGFSAAFSVPAPVVWSNKSRSNPLSRFSRLHLEWQGGLPGEFVTLFAMTQNNAANVYAVCTERAEVGVIEDPVFGPYTLPIDSRDFGGSLPGLIGMGSFAVRRFEAPGLDFGLVGVSFFDAIFSP